MTKVASVRKTGVDDKFIIAFAPTMQKAGTRGAFGVQEYMFHIVTLPGSKLEIRDEEYSPLHQSHDPSHNISSGINDF